MAEFTAPAAARHAVLERVVWDEEARGQVRAPPITVTAAAGLSAIRI